MFTTYDLVTYGTSGKACYGATSGAGDGYINPCIHSGVIAVSGDLPTTWYNYSLASAGTITGSSNSTKANESICPKGWTLPTKTQIDNTAAPDGGSGSQTYTGIFVPTLGGYYSNANLSYDSTRGYWWSSQKSSSSERSRWVLRYHDGGNLYTENSMDRYRGLSIRCVQSS